MRIGPHVLPNPLAVAPMAGVTDRPFRQLCKRLGAGLCGSKWSPSNPRLWATDKFAPSHRPRRRGRAHRRADRRRRSGDARRRRALQRRPRRADHRHQHGLPGEEGLQRVRPAPRCCRTSRSCSAIVEAVVRAVARARDAEDPHRLRPGRTQRRAHRAHGRGGGHRRARAAWPHARLRASSALPSTRRSRRQAGGRHPGVRQRRHRDGRRSARACSRSPAPTAVMIGRAAQGRPWIFREIAHLLATGERAAAADGRRGARLIARAPARPLRFLRRGARRAHRAQAPRLVHARLCRATDAFRASMNPADDRGRAARRDRGVFRGTGSSGRVPGLSGHAGRRCDATRPGRQRTTAKAWAGRPSRREAKRRLNGSNEIGRSVERSLDEYFRTSTASRPTASTTW